MIRTMLSSLAIAAILAMAAGGAVPADAAKGKRKATGTTQNQTLTGSTTTRRGARMQRRSPSQAKGWDWHKKVEAAR